jgi:hypothetical protein
MGHGALRRMRYSPGSAGDALAWQEELRARLFGILKMDDLVSRKVPADLRVETVSSEQREKYELRDLEIDSTAGRRMKVSTDIGQHEVREESRTLIGELHTN